MSWVPFVAAAATLIAALVALFKEDVVKKWRCPNLSPLTVFPPLVQSYAGLTSFHGRFQLLSSL
jgi:hypothetical protein